MDKWRECTLGEVATLNYGKALKEQERISGTVPVFSSAGIIGYHNEPLVNNRGIVIGRKGTVGKVYKSMTPFFCIDTAYYIIPRDEAYHLDYLYYLLQTLGLEQLNEDSAVPGLNRNTAYNQTIPLPPLPEQKAIATVLSSLDDKIDLLHRQNKTLESLAETLFRQWFIEEADEGWGEKPLSEVFTVKIGRTPPRKEFHWFSKSPKDVKWISIKDMGDSGLFIFNTNEYLTEEAAEKFRIPIIPKGTVVLSFKMTLGRIGITAENMLSNEAIAHFLLKDRHNVSNEYLYFYLKTFPYQTLGSTSSIVTSINSGMIKSLPLAVPPKELMQRFVRESEPNFEKIKFNQKQIRTLENLRDTLLPKLMSGEVRVKNGK